MAGLKRKARQKSAEKPIYLGTGDPLVWQPMVDAERIFLFLDLDGTLVEIAPTPQDVTLNPARRRCLENLSTKPGCMIAVVSGRGLEEVQKLIGLPTLFYAGLHGVVIATPQGKKITCPVSWALLDALQALRNAFYVSFSHVPGIFLEDKVLTLALHYRLAKGKRASEVTGKFLQTAAEHRARGAPIEILQGKKVIEVKPAGTHKGKAVTCLLERYGKGALPIYVGDDVTDEAAFESLRHRGIGILVAESPKPTAAAYYLHNPREVYAFVRRLIRRRAA